MPDYLAQEEDGTSKFTLEESGDSLLLEESLPFDFVAVGSLGCASEYNFSNYTLDISPSSNVPTGDLVAVFVAWTSHYFFGPSGVQMVECSVTDDAGNRYLQLFSSYGLPGAAYSGLFLSQLRNDLLTSNAITVKHYGPGAKAVCLYQFSLTPGKRWALDLERIGESATEVGGGGGGVLPDVSVSGLEADQEYLLLHALGIEGENTDTFTWDADYTQIAGTGTTGHGHDGGSGAPPLCDVSIRGGFRIVSGITDDTVTVSNDSGLRDMSHGLAPIRVIDADDDYPDFPNTPLLDNFNRANEDPLDVASTGLLWDKTGDHPQFGSAYARVVSNQAARSSGGSGGGSEAMIDTYDTEEGRGEVEEWGTIAVSGDIVIGFGTGDGNVSTFDALGVGYRDSGLRVFNAAAVPMGATFFGDVSPTGEMAGGPTESVVWGPVSNGNKIGVQQLNYDVFTHHLWMDVGAGWEWIAAVLRAGGTGFVNEGVFTIAFEGDSATRLDDLGGGTLEREAPQIIRRLSTDGKSLP